MLSCVCLQKTGHTHLALSDGLNMFQSSFNPPQKSLRMINTYQQFQTLNIGWSTWPTNTSMLCWNSFGMWKRSPFILVKRKHTHTPMKCHETRHFQDKISMFAGESPQFQAPEPSFIRASAPIRRWFATTVSCSIGLAGCSTMKPQQRLPFGYD